MVQEMRATRTELDNQRHFTKEKQPIELSRDHLAKWTEPKEARSVEVAAVTTARNLHAAADLIEVG
jgi:hypothetical protein